ncbi:MAG: hypothetical protein SGPRY_005230 [Prymnesium sp.]
MKSVQELSAKLRIKRVALQSDFGVCFRPFFAWLFEMGRKITAMNSGACPTVVRSVPCKEGLQLMGAVLGSWPLLPKFIQFCETVFLTPFSKDLWMQIGRFVEMTSSGQICGDLSNYDDELTGGGSAWPCAPRPAPHLRLAVMSGFSFLSAFIQALQLEQSDELWQNPSCAVNAHVMDGHM